VSHSNSWRVRRRQRRASLTPAQSHEATHEDFPLPTLGVLLLDVIEDVKRGRGFALLRGVPVHRWTRVQVRTLDDGWD
jgi:hypothetical protein